MIWIYIASAIFGLAFLLPMLLGGLDSDVDLGGDADLDLDADGAGEMDGDGGDTAFVGADSAVGAILSSIVSVRTVVFFTAFFGTSGVVFSILGYAPAVTVPTAVFIGVVAAVANSVLFGLVKQSQSTSQISDRTLEGRRASVVLPLEADRKGKIRIDLGGQPQYMVARALEAEGPLNVGAPVVVVKIEDGTALVASLRELESGDELDRDV
jgi:membrane protein implicated in regulation of membrane protease activity